MTYVWRYGQLGITNCAGLAVTDQAELVQSLKGVTQIHAGHNHRSFLNFPPFFIFSKFKYRPLSRRIFSENYVSIVLCEDGAVFCFGDNSEGQVWNFDGISTYNDTWQLGMGDKKARAAPTKVRFGASLLHDKLVWVAAGAQVCADL